MKTKLLLLIASLQLVFLFSQVSPILQENTLQNTFSNLDKSKIPNGLLLDAAVEFANLKKYDGTVPDSSFTSARLVTDIYNTLIMSRLHESAYIPKTSEEFSTAWASTEDPNVVSLAGLYYKYAQFSAETNLNAQTSGDPGTVLINGNSLQDKFVNGVWVNPYEEKKVFAISPSVNEMNRLNFSLVFPTDLFITNQQSSIQQIEYRLADNQPYQLLSKDQLINVAYPAMGTYKWTFKMTLTNGEILYTHTQFKVEGTLNRFNDPIAPNAKVLNDYVKYEIQPYNVPGVHPWNSVIHKAKATLYIRLAPGHQGITKPLIVAEGFDPGAILSPSKEAGANNIDDFIGSLRYLNNFSIDESLRNELLNNYDIIYVDWGNGTDYLQNNAGYLKEAIQYVNSQKALNGSTEKNVVIGQSMGALIARYALKDMETNGQNHDTKLFISHDGPHLGANIPIGLQQLLTHVSRTYIKAPLLAGVGQTVVPVFNQGISVGHILKLTDLPAARQMLLNYVNLSYGIDNTIHNNWQNELKAKGYPQQSRNVAISNGSECGNDQVLADLLRMYKETNQQHLFSDVIGTLLGGFTNNLSMISLASLPGSSKYVFDFTVRPMTSVNENKQLYSGNIIYKKKVLWIINAQATLFNGSANQPSRVLPYDKYGGGRYILSSDAIPASLESDITIRDFGFVPTPSALDLYSGNQNLVEADFQKPYSPIDDAAIVPFANFVAERVGENNQHISFSARNGQFVINQLSSNPAVQSETLTSTYLCGSKVKIGGDQVICSPNSIYTYTSGFAPSINWSVTQGANLVDIVSPFNLPEFKIKPKPNASGLVVLQTTLSGDGSSTNVIKRIWVGKPQISMEQNHGNYPGRVSVTLKSTVPGVSPEEQGVNPATIVWHRPDVNYTQTGGLTFNFMGTKLSVEGDPVQVTAANNCGFVNQLEYFIADSANCLYSIVKTNGYTYQIIPPCPLNQSAAGGSPSSPSSAQTKTTIIYNSMGIQVLSTSSDQFNLDSYMPGTYYAKIFHDGNLVYTQTLLKN